MSTLAVTNLKHESATGNNIVLDSSGNVAFADGSASAPSITNDGDTNTGIYFPAADNIGFATNGVIRGRWTTDGLCFGSDTAAANALDDYEEGTWTPAYSSGANSWAYTVQAGRYIKVGNCVTHTFYIAATGTINSTNAQVTITGLPFTSTGSNSDGRTNGSCKFGPDFGTQQIYPTSGAITWDQTNGVGDGNGWANTTNWPVGTSRLHYGTFVIILT